jgi:hypothetical protein
LLDDTFWIFAYVICELTISSVLILFCGILYKKGFYYK